MTGERKGERGNNARDVRKEIIYNIVIAVNYYICFVYARRLFLEKNARLSTPPKHGGGDL